MAFSRKKYRMKKVKILLKRFDRMESAMDRCNSTNDQVMESAGEKSKLKSPRVCLKRCDHDSALSAITTPNVENEDQVMKSSKEKLKLKLLWVCLKRFDHESVETVIDTPDVNNEDQVPTIKISKNIQTDGQLRQYPPRTLRSCVRTQAKASKEQVTEAQDAPCQLPTTHLKLQPDINDGQLRQYPPRTLSSVGTQAEDSKEQVTEAQDAPCQLPTTHLKLQPDINDGQLRQYPPRTLSSVGTQAEDSKEQVTEAQDAPCQLPTTHIKLQPDINDGQLRQYPPRTLSSVGAQAEDSKELVTEAQDEPCQLPTPQISLQPTTENDGALECLLCKCKFFLPYKLRTYSDENSQWYCSQCKCLLKSMRVKRVPWRRNRHPCLMCKRYFAQSVFMWGHIMRDHGLPLECAKCANQFYTPAMYLSHKKSCSGSSKPTEKRCATSKRQFSRLEQYKCAACASIFPTLSAFRGHLKLHNESPRYQCSLCDCAFLSHPYLKYHLGLVHSLAQYRCLRCSRKFCTKYRLSCHLRSHSRLNVYCQCCGQLKRIHSQRGKRGQAYCAECIRCLNPKNTPVQLRNMSAPNEKSLSLEELHGVAQFRCTFCSQEFAFKSEFMAHSLTHRPRGLRCGLCDTYFPNKIFLSEHIVSHLEVETFQCAQCDKVFAQRAQLMEHLSNEHFGSVAKSCYEEDIKAGLESGTLVAPKTELDDSIKCKTEALFSCHICDSSFKNQPSLDQHDCALEEFGFSCAVCEEFFISKLALEDHLSLHSKGSTHLT